MLSPVKGDVVTTPTYNIWGNDHIGQVRRNGSTLTRYYYLKDHLGSIRATVKGGDVQVADDFSGTLSKWTTVLGTGFSIISGELANSSSGADNLLVNSSSATLGDGILSVDVKCVTSNQNDPSVLVRYQDINNYYMVHPRINAITIYERLSGTYYSRAVGTIPTIVPGQWYHLVVIAEGSTIKAYWNGQFIVSWTDGTPWLTGKVGYRQCLNRNVRWDNMLTLSSGPVGQVIAYDDFYPFGMQMEERSYNAGSADARYKYTGKERDAETNYDYFGARYYDARIGRFLAVDPHASAYPALSPFAYAGNNALAFVDPSGMDSTVPPPPSKPDAANVLVLAPELFGPIVLPEVLPLLPIIGALGILTVATTNTANEGEDEALAKKQENAQSTDKGAEKAEQKAQGVKKDNTALAEKEPTAEQIISKELKGYVNREFPEQLRSKTKSEIQQLLKSSDSRIRNAAKRALKILTDKRFKK